MLRPSWLATLATAANGARGPEGAARADALLGPRSGAGYGAEPHHNRASAATNAVATARGAAKRIRPNKPGCWGRAGVSGTAGTGNPGGGPASAGGPTDGTRSPGDTPAGAVAR